MRGGQTHHINSVIHGGDFTGPERRPMGRVTVDHLWNLNLEYGPVGAYPDGTNGRSRFPIRWFASATNPAWKNETEIPYGSVKSIHCEWSIDQEAASAAITIFNTLMSPPSYGLHIGNPGAFTPDRGQPGNRWGHTPNDWENVIVEGAMLRTYQGYGGYDDDGAPKSIATCLAGGYVVQTGTWLIDYVDLTSEGTLVCTCRDMASLLIDQDCYPPLVPRTFYPVDYTRYQVRKIVTPKVDYGSSVGGAKLIVGGAVGPVVSDATGHENTGYWLCGDDGGVFTYGTNDFKGSNISIASHTAIGIAPGSFVIGGHGYYVAQSNGVIDVFGAPDLGDAPIAAAPYVDITAPANFAAGLYLVTSIGEVAHLSTTYYGGTPVTPAPMVAIASRPDGDGYWLLNSNGQVYAYGAAPYAGNTPNDTGDPAVKIVSSYSGGGYYIVDSGGHVYAFGDAVYRGGADSLSPPIVDPISSMMLTPTGNGYWLVGEDGGVFAFGDAVFYGSLPHGSDSLVVEDDGNIRDFSDMVRDFLLWSGFHLENGDLDDDGYPAVYGSIEKTGSFPTDAVSHDLFDKQHMIDCVTKIKEVVGYIIQARADGSMDFHSPNWWGPGNILPDGTHTTFVPVIDERYDLTQFGVRRSRLADRQQITITTDDPDTAGGATLSSTFILPSNGIERGIVRQSMLVNSLYTSQLDQEIMAELIAMHIMFQRRLGNVACVANPLLEVDDQVQIMEETAEEMWVHYMRGLTTDQDLVEGSYTAQLTTHWLGDKADWTITIPDGFNNDEVP